MAGTITSLGLGSGLDIDSIIDNLIQVQSRPIQLLQSRQEEIDLKISGLGQIRSAIDALRQSARALTSQDAFLSTGLGSSDETIVTGSAGENAIPASYDIEVTQLASRHKIATQIFADKTAALGEGTIQIVGGGSSFSVNIDSTNSSLEQIRDAINGHAANLGVTASVINVDGGSSLVLSSNSTGLNGAIAVNVTDNDGNNADDAGLSQLIFDSIELQAARDASLTVDGLAVTSSTNTVTGVVDDVTLDLQSVGSATVEVTLDRSVAGSSIGAIADSYNKLITIIQTQRAGFLSGDATLLTIENRIRSTFSTAYGTSDSSIKYTSQVGLSFDEDGILSFNKSNFNNAIDENFEDVVAYFTSDSGGFADSLDSLLDSFLSTNGLIDARTDGLNASRDDLDDDIDTLQARLDATEERLIRQYSALDGLVAQLNATSSFLTTQLENLPAFNNNDRN